MVPSTAIDLQKVEAANRRAARWVYRNYRYPSGVTAMMMDLNWRPLDQRRIYNRLTMLYKDTYDLVAIPASQYLTRNTRLSRHIHPFSYRQIPTPKHYFSQSQLFIWNALPAHIPDLPTLTQFSSAVWQVIHVSPKTPVSVY